MSSQSSGDGLIRIVLIALAIVIFGPLLMMGLTFPVMGSWGGGMMGGYGGYGGTVIWGIGMLLIWLVILVGGGYFAYRWVTQSSGLSHDPAIKELRLAYARGDISEEEFEQRRSKLDGE